MVTKRTIAAAILALAGSAHAEFWHGARLMEMLDADAAITARGNRPANADEAFDAGIGAGYIIGIHDTHFGVTVCTPRGIAGRTVVEIVRAHLRDQSPRRLASTEADRLVLEALRAEYPCTSRRGT